MRLIAHANQFACVWRLCACDSTPLVKRPAMFSTTEILKALSTLEINILTLVVTVTANNFKWLVKSIILVVRKKKKKRNQCAKAGVFVTIYGTNVLIIENQLKNTHTYFANNIT